MKKRKNNRKAIVCKAANVAIPTTVEQYEACFFQKVEIKSRSGKTVYIRKEFHERIMRIVRVIGENDYTLFDYLNNVLEHHFDTYQNEITELYRKKNTDIF